MNSKLPLKRHITIRKGFSLPPVQKCNNCCIPSKFHCPFCSPAFYKPTKRCRVMDHLVIHLNRAFFFGNYTIHRCGLDCRLQPHFHCLYCTSTVIRKKEFINHLTICHQAQQDRAQEESEQLITNETPGAQTNGLTPGKSYTSSYDMESDDDQIAIVPGSEGQNTEEASSSQSMTPTIRQSYKCESFKCHQTVQTDIDKPQDCDEFYFMSLVKMFKKLSPKKKSDVRLKIERLLFEAEFE